MSGSSRQHATQHPPSLYPGGGNTPGYRNKPGQYSRNASGNQLFHEKPNLSHHPSILQAGHRRDSLQPSWKASGNELFLEEPKTSSQPQSLFEEELFLHAPKAGPSQAPSKQVDHGKLPSTTATHSKLSNQRSRRPKLSLQTAIPPTQTKYSLRRSKQSHASLSQRKHVGASDKLGLPQSPLEFQDSPALETGQKPFLDSSGEIYGFSHLPGHAVSPMEAPISRRELYKRRSPAPKKPKRRSSPRATVSQQHPLHSAQITHPNMTRDHESQPTSRLSDESRWVNTRSAPPSQQYDSSTQHGGTKKGGLRDFFGRKKNK